MSEYDGEPEHSGNNDASEQDALEQSDHHFTNGIIPDQYAVIEEVNTGVITPGEFDVSRFEDLRPRDATESSITKLAFESALYALAGRHADVLEVTKKMHMNGCQADNIEGMLEVSDDSTNATIQLILQRRPEAQSPLVDANSKGDSVIIKTYGTDGTEKSFNAYYTDGGGVYKNVISLTPMARIPQQNEATEATRLEMAADYVRTMKELFANAKAAGLIHIPVSAEEVGYVARFIKQAQQRQAR